MPPVGIASHDIGFGNKQAVRTALIAAGVASLLMTMPLPLAPFFWILWLLAAGFVAVYLYHRRTGEPVTLRSGVRLGWLTGLFCYMILLVLMVASAIAVSTNGGMAELWRRQVRDSAQPGMNVEEVLRLLESPAGLVTVMVFTLVLLFMFLTAVPMIGGAVGAKVLEKE